VELLTDRLSGLKVLAGEVLQAENQGLASDRLLNDIRMDCELIAYRGSDEIGAVGIKSFLYQQIDLS
jgi:hypothetical protein